MYTGYKKLSLNDNELNELYTTHNLSGYDFLENEYLCVTAENSEERDYFQYRNGELRQVRFSIIDNPYTGKYKPRNDEQIFAFDMLKDEQTTIKLITGRFGTGKTLMLVVAALEALDKGRFEKIIWVRNNVQVKDTDPLGALPGDAYEKLLPYLGPMADHVGGADGIRMLVNSGKLEVIPLAHLRGRSIRNSIIISSEAENLTKEHIQLLTGRVDEGSNLWMDADLKQRDKAIFEKSQGIEKAIAGWKGEPLFGYVHLVQVERSATARLADKLDDV